MNTQEGIVIVLILLAVLFFVAKRQGWSPNWLNFRQLGVMSSSKGKSGVMVMAAIAVIIAVIIWFWAELTSLHAEWFGSSFPLWGYAAIVAGLIAIIWLVRMGEEGREKSMVRLAWLIGFGFVAYGLIMLTTWVREDTVCPDKQAITSVPATGMVIDLHSCWKEPFIVLDLREVGITQLSFNQESAVFRGREINEFADLQSNYPGAIDGQGKVIFYREEMHRLGVTNLQIFVGPARNQLGTKPRFTDADIDALTQ